MTNQVILSIATVPDIEALRSIHKFDDLSDEGVLSAALHLHHQQNGNKILPLYQQQIVSIGAVKRLESGEVALHGFDHQPENEVDQLVQLNEFTANAEKIISWEMNSFDLPLINYRLLNHNIACVNFYKACKVSLSDCLRNSDGDSKGNAGVDLAGLSRSLGFPDIDSLTQQESIECFLNNQMQRVHTANQTMVLNCYLINLRYQLIRKGMSSAEYDAACEKLFEALGASGEIEHL